MLKVLFLSKIYPACHLDDKSIKPGSNSIMTDKHTAEHSRAACLGIYWPKCGVYIAHTTIKPEVSISLTEMPFLILQVNFYTSNDFVIGVSIIVPKNHLQVSVPFVVMKEAYVLCEYIRGYAGNAVWSAPNVVCFVESL